LFKVTNFTKYFSDLLAIQCPPQSR